MLSKPSFTLPKVENSCTTLEADEAVIAVEADEALIAVEADNADEADEADDALIALEADGVLSPSFKKLESRNILTMASLSMVMVNDVKLDGNIRGKILCVKSIGKI